ncbi:MAG: DUF547 domain-containing protein [Gemmatimonadales bacterium]
MKRRPVLATLASLALLRALAPLGGHAAQGLPDHEVFSAVLREHVRGGLVDYATLQDDSARRRSYLDYLAGAAPEAVAAADRPTRLAFWINAYNACMLKQVIEHYPIERAAFRRLVIGSTSGRAASVRDIPGVFKRKHCRVAGALRSQDDIEHGIVRPMGDARIHFAVNCAARSCPVLAAEAYVAERLDQQLDAAVHRFVETDTQLRIAVADHVVLEVNKILDWYSKDFGGPNGVKQFFARYLPPDAAASIQRADVRLRFFDYDWTLNDVTR